MALIIGSEDADSGMSRAIYLEIDRLMSPPLVGAVNDANDEAKPAIQTALDEARSSWKKLSFAIATGVINHIKSNMEIEGIESKGTVIVQGKADDETLTIKGDAEEGFDVIHTHDINFNAKIKTDVKDGVFTQSNNGTGHVK